MLFTRRVSVRGGGCPQAEPALQIDKDIEAEHRQPQHVAPPQPARLTHQAHQPFQPHIGHPSRRPAHPARRMVNQRARRNEHAGGQVVDIVTQPDFLPGHAHGQQDDVGLCHQQALE